MSFEIARLSPGLGRLFAPYRVLLGESPMPRPPAVDAIGELLGRVGPRNAVGKPLRVVDAEHSPALAYERRVLDDGLLATRADSWHDYFNALVWCAFPATKAVINRRHCDAAGRDDCRGAVRDALTQFDECGALVISADAEMLDALRGHCWERALWRRRAHFLQTCRVLVVGHATLDALRRPFAGLCAKALYREVASDWIAQAAEDQMREADHWLADWLSRRGDALVPRDLSPLPLLGLPEVVPENACADYYRDHSQFRPRRVPGLGGMRCR